MEMEMSGIRVAVQTGETWCCYDRTSQCHKVFKVDIIDK